MQDFEFGCTCQKFFRFHNKNINWLVMRKIEVSKIKIFLSLKTFAILDQHF